LKGSYAKGKSVTAAHVHVFNPGTTKGQLNSGMLGVELDCSYDYSLSEATKISLGYSHLLATDQMVALKGGIANQMHNWAYLMFSFNF